jgi:ribose 5-phosphate isomerase B
MKIAIGSDHAGVKLKEFIKSALKGAELIDMGTHSEESTDYPDHIAAVARMVQRGEADAGIGICGTGIGASIVANKFRGIRAALCTSESMAEMAKRHNNANVLILGARHTGEELSIRIIRSWMENPFEGGRHQRRLDKITGLEADQCAKS